MHFCISVYTASALMLIRSGQELSLYSWHFLEFSYLSILRTDSDTLYFKPADVQPKIFHKQKQMFLQIYITQENPLAHAQNVFLGYKQKTAKHVWNIIKTVIRELMRSLLKIPFQKCDQESNKQ